MHIQVVNKVTKTCNVYFVCLLKMIIISIARNLEAGWKEYIQYKCSPIPTSLVAWTECACNYNIKNYVMS